MSEDYESFARQLSAKDAGPSAHREMRLRCPHCREVMHESYIEQNPFAEIPCSSCGSLISIDAAKEVGVTSREQRAEKRCPLSLKVSYRTYDQFIEEYTKNVSRQGMFIRTTRVHNIHDRVDLFLHVPGLSEPVHIIAEVMHVTAQTDNPDDAGVGVKFVDIGDKSRQALIAYIKSQESCT